MKPVHWIIALTLVCAVVACLWPAVPQPQNYHNFADSRPFAGVPNFLDVASNIGFVIAGAAGLCVTLRKRTSFEHRAERWPYAVSFLGVLLTAFGSSYYHVAPDNERLFWDRLPMTMAFMGLIAAQIVDRVDRRAGLALLGPMLVTGAVSVLYWRATERAGVGNVLPYGVLQGYSVAILLLIALLQPSRYTRGNDIYWVFAWYVISKLLELFDDRILEFSGVVSGHSLKHLAAAVAGLCVCRMLLRRRSVLELSQRGQQ